MLNLVFERFSKFFHFILKTTIKNIRLSTGRLFIHFDTNFQVFSAAAVFFYLLSA